MDIPVTTIERRRFETPEEELDFGAHGQIRIVTLPDGTKGMHAVFESGWVWEKHEKPLLGNPDTCPMPHTGYCIAGEIVVRMVESGTQTRLGPGDFFVIPPGHDAYVPGDEACEMILFAPPQE